MSGPLAWSHRTTAIPEIGLHLSVAATEAERLAIAKELGLLSCEAVEVDYTIRALGMSRCRFTGHLRARLTQACVATLEPLPRSIEEEFEVEFWPAGSLPEMVDAEVEALSVPDVEPIEHGTVGVGRVVFETLSAALDPYPRKCGASLEWRDPERADETGARGPFEALKKLKDQT
jgi:uncharacterized metal-binding protein YceD (DUF177 family)